MRAWLVRIPGVIVAMQAALLAVQLHPALASNRTVTFVVRVPASTPADDGIYISGNIADLGPWDPGRRRLDPIGDGQFRTTLQLPASGVFEYKITRGSWETVEKGAAGEEIANRRLDLATPAGRAATDGVVAVVVQKWRDQVAGTIVAEPTWTGDVRHFGRLRSNVLERTRDVWVYLPPGYETTDRRYPVVYFHDGQNVFDANTAFIGIEWQADETLERLIQAGTVRAAIAVAVANTPNRLWEYTQVADSRRSAGGGAAAYLEFLASELKPRIDAAFRTLPDRDNSALVGSSLGGLVSLYGGIEKNRTFGLVAGLSPTAWWGNHDLERRYLAAPAAARPLRVWIDMGTREGSVGGPETGAIRELRRLRRVLEKCGYVKGSSLGYVEDPGAEHNEAAWAKRLPQVLEFLLGSGS